MPRLLKPSLDWLLVFVPLAVGLHFLAPERHTLTFFAACAGIVPLAGWMGRATERLAERAGEGVGGLLNATFGNAAELIIAIMALRRGLRGVVKASLTGSIIGNVLLVLGASVLAGGVRYEHQRFNRAGARVQSTMLILAAIGLIMPAAYHYLVGAGVRNLEGRLSLDISYVLLATYAASLVFSLRTHKGLFAGQAPAEHREDPAQGAEAEWSLGRAVAVLAGATALVAWLSEILVGAVEPTAAALGMTETFIGVVVVAIIGNAAEHSTAVMMAVRNRMDLALGIALGSSVQIALLAAPLLVILSHFVGPQPMDLVFTPAEVLAVGVAVVIAGQIAGDGESNWLEGVQLLAVYVILALVFYFVPA